MKQLAAIFGCILLSAGLMAQRTPNELDPEKLYREGYQQYQQSLYGAAQALFKRYQEIATSSAHHNLSDAFYYEAACATELFQNNALYLLDQFRNRYPESPKIAMSWLQTGRIHFREKEYQEAEMALSKADPYLLNKEDFSEYYFKLGYSRYMQGNSKDALLAFDQMNERESKWQIPALYYTGHIYYENEDFEKALQYFKRVEHAKAFARLVPLYIVQIYYRQGRYEQVATYGSPLADTLKGRHRDPVRRILAESWFRLKNYDKALEVYQLFQKDGGQLDREGRYNLGLSYFYTEQWKEAAESLAKATDKDDSLSQTAYYFLASALMEMNQKKLALDALRMVHALDFDDQLSQEALFNFAKLSFELGYNPYNEAVGALERYLELYPNALYKEEARKLMVEIHVSAKNYRLAIEALEKMDRLSPELSRAFQRVLYFRAVELFNNLELEDAIPLFQRAIRMNKTPEITASARYWLGETFYQLKSYPDAIGQWESFLSSPSASSLEEYAHVYYHLGYARLKLKDYAGALTEFRTYLTQNNSPKDAKANDALLRSADCFFVLKRFEQALEAYRSSANHPDFGTDYAFFQLGMLQGLTGDQAGKEQTMGRLAENFPTSPLNEEALYEKGLAAVRQDKPNQALTTFDQLRMRFPKGFYFGKSLLQSGLVHRNNGQSQEALGWFRRVVDEYPGTEEANLAMGYAKSIYTENGQVEAWLQFVKEKGGNRYSEASLDSSAFDGLQNAVISGDCQKISSAGQAYLKAFPQGIFALKAAHYAAECLFEDKNDSAALVLFERVLEAPNGSFTENALVKAGYLYSAMNDTLKAMRTYERLIEVTGSSEHLKTSRIALMEYHFALNQWSEAMHYANLVQSFESLAPSELERSLFVLTRSNYRLEQWEMALASARKAEKNKNSGYFAEVAFIMGDVLYKKEEYRQAERELRKAIKHMGGEKDWMAKSFILLSDIYLKLDDLIQAKSVLKSVIDNHEGVELVQAAQEKYQAILDLEQERNRPEINEPEEFEIAPNE